MASPMTREEWRDWYMGQSPGLVSKRKCDHGMLMGAYHDRVPRCSCCGFETDYPAPKGDFARSTCCNAAITVPMSVSTGVSFGPVDPSPDLILIYGDDGKVIMRMDRSGNVALWGDVNEAALRFWNAVCQLSGGILTKHKGGIISKDTLGIIGDGSPELVAKIPRSIIKICCHGCSEFHEFNIETGKCLSGKAPAVPDSMRDLVCFLYSCTHGTAYSHPPLEELHELTDGTYADPEQWYKFSKELWGSYRIKTKGYVE